MEELIKWHYVTSRPLTENVYIWDGTIPEDEETVIVSDGETVWVDMWMYYGDDDYNFESVSDLKEFYWASIPKPPIREVE
ncbi:hypothetical protein ACWOBH_06135 [Globicatella sanguinis]